MCTEFLGLNECAIRKFLSGNSRGETEIVLDPGTRSRLPTRCVLLEDEDMQPLGGSIERRGQPAWSRADHNHVAQVALFDSGVQSKAGSRFGIGRIAP